MIKLPLTYCLNIHPGENWAAQAAAVRNVVPQVRRALKWKGSFPLGLRLGAAAVADIEKQPRALRAFDRLLETNKLHVAGFNGFPYGAFHGRPVKTEVYRPDWTDPRRVKYTLGLSTLAAHWGDKQSCPGITTLPVGWGADFAAPERLAQAAGQLAQVCFGFHVLAGLCGRELRLELEPEPGCVLEDVASTIAFFKGPLRTAVMDLFRKRGMGLRVAHAALCRHLGVCLDTCHFALAFEHPADALRRLQRAGIRVTRLQISAALEAVNTPAARARLAQFDEPVYLHQTAARLPDGTVRRWSDLPEALAQLPALPESALVRVHFHVPLHWQGDGVLRSTAPLLDGALRTALRRAPVRLAEVETYTFSVLPSGLAAGPMAESIARELAWARAWLAGK